MKRIVIALACVGIAAGCSEKVTEKGAGYGRPAGEVANLVEALKSVEVTAVSERATLDGFIAVFKEAYEANDTETLESLHYWVGTPDDLKQSMMQMSANPQGMTLEDISFVPMDSGAEAVSVRKGGVKFVANLEVEGNLSYVMVYDDAQGNVSASNTEQSVGKVDGLYYFSGVKAAS